MPNPALKSHPFCKSYILENMGHSSDKDAFFKVQFLKNLPLYGDISIPLEILFVSFPLLFHHDTNHLFTLQLPRKIGIEQSLSSNFYSFNFLKCLDKMQAGTGNLYEYIFKKMSYLSHCTHILHINIYYKQVNFQVMFFAIFSCNSEYHK